MVAGSVGSGPRGLSLFLFSSGRRHTRSDRDWSSDVCSSDLWQAHSMFLLPRGCYHQFSNAQGHRPARLIHFNYLPLAFATIPDPSYFFNNSYVDPWVISDRKSVV